MTQQLDALALPFRRIPTLAPRVLQPKRQELLFRHCVLAADALALTGSFLLAYALRNQFAAYGTLLPLETYGWVLGCVIGVWLTLARMTGLAESRSYMWLQRTLLSTLKVHAMGGLIVLSALYLLKAYDVSRLFMETFLAVSALVMLAERVAVWGVLANLARRPAAHIRRLLVIGTTPAAARLDQLFRTHPHWGAEIVGFVSLREEGLPLEGSDLRLLGTLGDVPALLNTMIFDEIVVTDGVTDNRDIRGLAETCLERGLTFHTLVPMPASTQGRYHAEAIDDGLYLMSLEATPQGTLALLLKRTIDVIGAAVGLMAFGVVYVVFAPIIRWESEGAALFSQTRVGRNGRQFTLFKLRTMCSDAEALRGALAGANDMSGHLFKIRHDPRITRVGRFLRRTYLDEFPQFWNVLRGDMSLVGTRPPTVEEAASYSPHHRRRLSMRPGLTGLWQTSGNGTITDFEDVVRLDCDYIERWSIWLDLRILLQTCVTVARLAGH
jgi:exopolysaccharide biosynthesis polyprenyl glycosylphosphotransferase